MTVTREQLAEEDPDILFCDGFDEALIGVCHRFNDSFALYDRKKVIEILMRDMSREEAEEYFSFNVIGAWVGDYTPAFADLATEERRSRVSAQEEIKKIDAFYGGAAP